MWTSKQTELTQSRRSDGGSRGDRLKLSLYENPSGEITACKILSMRQTEAKHLEGGLKINAYVCACLCLHAHMHGPFWWHLCDMLPILQHVQHKSQWPGKSSIDYLGQLVVSSSECPWLWAEIRAMASEWISIQGRSQSDFQGDREW